MNVVFVFRNKLIAFPYRQSVVLTAVDVVSVLILAIRLSLAVKREESVCLHKLIYFASSFLMSMNHDAYAEKEIYFVSMLHF